MSLAEMGMIEVKNAKLLILRTYVEDKSVNLRN